MSRIRTVFGLVVVLAAGIWSGQASAQSGCQYIATGAVLTAGQWNSCFSGKSDFPLPPGTGRTRLTGATTFYVNGSTGSDSNLPCTTSGAPCLTKQAVINNIQNTYDLAGQAVTINSIGDATALTIDGPFVGDNSSNNLPLVTLVGDPPVTITNCTNATPIVVTASGHTYNNGDHVIISGVGGNANCNGAYVVALSNQGAGTFALTSENGGGSIAGSGAYTSGGTVQAPSRQTINGGSGNAVLLINGAQANFSGFGLTVANSVSPAIDLFCSVGSRCYLTGKMDFQGSGTMAIGITSNKAAYIQINDSFSIDMSSGENFVHEPHGGVLFVLSSAFYLRANCTFPTTNVNGAFLMSTDSDVSWTPSVTSYGFTCSSTLQWLIRDKGSIQVNSGAGAGLGGQIPPPDGFFPGDTVGQYQTPINANASPVVGPGYMFTNAQMTILPGSNGIIDIGNANNPAGELSWFNSNGFALNLLLPSTGSFLGNLSFPSLGGGTDTVAVTNLTQTLSNKTYDTGTSAGNVFLVNGTGPLHTVADFQGYLFVGSFELRVALVNFNATNGTDIVHFVVNLPTNATGWQIQGLKIFNCTGSITSAHFGLFDAVSAGGNTIISNTTGTNSSQGPAAANSFQTVTQTTASSWYNSANVYLNLITAEGSAVTCSVTLNLIIL